MIRRFLTSKPIGWSVPRAGLMVLTGVVAAIAVAASLLAVRYQDDLSAASRYDGAFELSQAVVELLRLQGALVGDGTGNSRADLPLRRDIFANRLNIMESNPLLPDHAVEEVILPLRGTVQAIDDYLQGPQESSQREHLIAELVRAVPLALHLSSEVHSRHGELMQRSQNSLKMVLLALGTVTLLLVLLGVALLRAVMHQSLRFQQVAQTDVLTGLPNRLAFNRAVAEAKGAECAIALVDVDHFKTINDTLGHEAGDRLLVTVARRLAKANSGSAHLARIGGDEFAALFDGPDAARESLAFCAAIQTALEAPAILAGRAVPISVTQGLRISRDADRSELFNEADIALYAAKTAGRGRYLVFEPAMKETFLRRQRLSEDMRRAGRRGEFFLLYQPIVDLETGAPIGYEALLRWRHSELGLVSPAEFIPIAEENGLIGEIGRWVIAEACRQAAAWPAAMFVAVNVSARQLTEPSLLAHVTDTLARNNMAGDRLEIEITESTLIENDGASLELLRRLQELGCRISLDDFGTGYASLSYLRRFRFDKLKIDQSFIRGDTFDDEGLAIVTMICLLAQRLGLTVVAEGIETEEQRLILHSAGGQFGQGYLFNPPLTPRAVEDALKLERLLARA